MDAPLTIRLFGPMHVLAGGVPLPKMRSRKALWLLALLTTRANRPVSRQWIAATLWPDVDLATAFANLRPVLSELRHALGGVGGQICIADRNSIGIDLREADVDVACFDAAMREEDFARAIGFYQGAFLEGCNEEWVGQERIARELDCLRALETLGERAIEARDFERAVTYFSRAIRMDAWRDAPRRGLMQAFSGKGDINAALHTYREFAHFLGSSASTEPDPATAGLYGQLRTIAKRGHHRQAAPTFPPCPLCGSAGKAEARSAFETTYHFGAYRFVPGRQLLLKDDLPVRIGARALDLLHLLVQRAGEVVSKDDLIRHGWPDTYVHENNLMVNISALRRALAQQDPSFPSLVTVPGRGYRFVAPVRVLTMPVASLLQPVDF